MVQLDWAAIRREAMAGIPLDLLPPDLKLPAHPEVVSRFLEKSQDTSASVKELARIAQTDAGLSMALLRHVNSSPSPSSGQRRTLISVQQAIEFLGPRESRNFVSDHGIAMAGRARQSRLINHRSFWSTSLQKALFARKVARLLRANAAIAYTGALLQDYLLPVLTDEMLDDYLQFLQTRDQQPTCLCEFEQRAFGWTHALAGACLAYRWCLPDELVCCILFHHRRLTLLSDPQLRGSPAAAIALSALLPDELRQHDGGLEALWQRQTEWVAFRLDELVRCVDREHDAQGLGIRTDFPLARRCRLTSRGTANRTVPSVS